MDWQWWVAQGFALVGLLFVVISFQQKSARRLILFRNFATWFVFVGLCFLGNVSAIILCGAGILRNAVSLFFACKPETKEIYKYIAGGVIVCLLVVLNIVFWKDWFNFYSIVLGSLYVFTFFQPTPKRIRILSVFAQILAIMYYVFLFSPVNMVIEIVSLVSVVVGIVRLDIKKKDEKDKETLEKISGDESCAKGNLI